MMATASRRALLGGLAALPALTVPVIAATDPHVAYRERLHLAWGEWRRAAPIDNSAGSRSLEGRACTLVYRQVWRLADEVLELPAPTTLAGLGVVGLALALMLEGMGSPHGGDLNCYEEDRSIALVRAVLAVTGEALPQGFPGFGDEPGFLETENAYREAGVGSIPAWALAQAGEGRA